MSTARVIRVRVVIPPPSTPEKPTNSPLFVYPFYHSWVSFRFDFESGFGGWKQLNNKDGGHVGFEVNSGMTSSTPYGPTNDHTSQQAHGEWCANEVQLIILPFHLNFCIPLSIFGPPTIRLDRSIL